MITIQHDRRRASDIWQLPRHRPAVAVRGFAVDLPPVCAGSNDADRGSLVCPVHPVVDRQKRVAALAQGIVAKARFSREYRHLTERIEVERLIPSHAREKDSLVVAIEAAPDGILADLVELCKSENPDNPHRHSGTCVMTRAPWFVVIAIRYAGGLLPSLVRISDAKYGANCCWVRAR